MMTIPVSGIPKGYKAVAVRLAQPGELVVNHVQGGGVSMVPDSWNSLPYSEYPQIILEKLYVEKLYDPGIGIPNGWKVWFDNRGGWSASEIGNSRWKISGLQHFRDFVPPPIGAPAIVERQV
jgi:hypothetical protein